MSPNDIHPTNDDASLAMTIAMPARGQGNSNDTPAAATPSQGTSQKNSIASPGQQLIGGRYELIRLVGVGGMGSVYQVRDAELDEIVALKTLRREMLEDPGMHERFKNEVKLARRVTHRNVARMFDIGEHEGEKFLTMEFVDGESLAGVLTRERRLPTARVVELMTAVCAGLAAAHAAGVIHRDLKPDNVMIAKDGRVLVTDFGIARASLDSSHKTVGMVLGTPGYMAPEQVQGLKDLDGRVDIYALGVMLFELFTGEDAWTGETPLSIATARLLAPPPDPRSRRSDVPDVAARVVLKCMARDRSERYASADQVARDLALLTMPSAPATNAITLERPIPAPLPVAADKTVAVLPFRNAGAADDAYLAEGLTDDLIDTLSMTRGLRVCSRGAVSRFKGAAEDPRVIGKELGVQVVVEGSFRKLGGSARINARLISVTDGFQLWAKRFDCPEKDLLTMNDDVARAIAEALMVDATAPAREAPSDPVVVDLYLRARNEYHKVSPEHVARAVELFEQALARAPNDLTLLSGYAIARARYNFFTGEGNDRAKAAAMRAVEAAPNLAEARLALATVQIQSGEPAGALREAKLAVTKGPGLAEAHWLLGRILCEVGKADDGVRHLEVAMTLDPSLELSRRDLARVYALLGEWDKSDRYLAFNERAMEDPGLWIDRSRLTLWRRDAALAARHLSEMPPNLERGAIARLLFTMVADGGKTVPYDDPMVRGTFGAMQSGTGRRHAFFAQVDAELAVFLGLNDRAIEAIRRAIDAGLIDILWLDRCPLFEEIRKTFLFRVERTRLAERASQILNAYVTR